eukprot:6210035-Pleurochrysis_carterae.AAC.2
MLALKRISACACALECVSEYCECVSEHCLRGRAARPPAHVRSRACRRAMARMRSRSRAEKYSHVQAQHAD